jgi:hypothetical protein
MSQQPAVPVPTRGRAAAVAAPALLALAVCGGTVYANLAFAVTDPANYRYFPPFEPNVNGNHNRHLGSEYFNIARALASGKGFANPFGNPTGPTAWHPPAMPFLMAGVLRACDGSRDAVMVVVIVLQALVLLGTGLLVVALLRETHGPVVAAVGYVVGLVCYFGLCFQITHDSWLVLLAVDGVLAGLCWGRPLRRVGTGVVWGAFGGGCALVNPMVALAWGALSLYRGARARAWRPLAGALLTAGLVLAPWTVRNYLVLGRWVPVKSNLAYELYQSQCLQPDGLLQPSTFRHHPGNTGPEGREYTALGESVYMDRKRDQFWQSVRADPVAYLDRAAGRFLGATLWYQPFDRGAEAGRPWALALNRLIHPLPFLALLVLLASAAWQPLTRPQGTVIAVYFLYLLPYVGASYYERYAIPLLGVKVVLVLWAVGRLLPFRPGRAAAAVSSGVSHASDQAENSRRGAPPRDPGRRPRAAPVATSRAGRGAGCCGPRESRRNPRPSGF